MMFYTVGTTKNEIEYLEAKAKEVTELIQRREENIKYIFSDEAEYSDPGLKAQMERKNCEDEINFILCMMADRGCNEVNLKYFMEEYCESDAM